MHTLSRTYHTHSRITHMPHFTLTLIMHPIQMNPLLFFSILPSNILTTLSLQASSSPTLAFDCFLVMVWMSWTGEWDKFFKLWGMPKWMTIHLSADNGWENYKLKVWDEMSSCKPCPIFSVDIPLSFMVCTQRRKNSLVPRPSSPPPYCWRVCM